MYYYGREESVMSGFRFQIVREGPRGCWSRGERCVLWKVYIGEERRALGRSVVDEIRSGGWGSTARNVPTFKQASKQSRDCGGGLERLAWSCRGRESPCSTLQRLSHSALVSVLGFDSTRRVLCLCSLLRRDTHCYCLDAMFFLFCELVKVIGGCLIINGLAILLV